MLSSSVTGMTAQTRNSKHVIASTRKGLAAQGLLSGAAQGMRSPLLLFPRTCIALASPSSRADTG
jgi:hypothetical protein